MPISGPDPRRRRWCRRAPGTPPLKLIVAGALSLGCLVAPSAAAAQDDDAARFEQGEQLYAEHCARCHGASGAGSPPAFPALSGNDQLADAARIVRILNQGNGNMPPFPALAAAETAALASYVRNAWTNAFGSVTAGEAAAALAEVADAGPAASVWDGVFTEAQAARGREAYSGACSFCHGRRLNGAPDDPDMRSTPPLVRARFLREWDGRSLATLFAYTRQTMPEDNPGSMTDQEFVDVIAYMLSFGGMPAGDDELPPDPRGLARIVIRQR